MRQIGGIDRETRYSEPVWAKYTNGRSDRKLSHSGVASSPIVRYHFCGDRGAHVADGGRRARTYAVGTSQCDVAIGWARFCGTIIETRREFVNGRSACHLIELATTVNSYPPDPTLHLTNAHGSTQALRPGFSQLRAGPSPNTARSLTSTMALQKRSYARHCLWIF
jgi:hypothetical protein